MSDTDSEYGLAHLARQIAEQAPAINEALQQWGIAIRDSLAPVATAIASLNTPENLARLRRFAQQLQGLQEVAQWWIEEAPNTLKEALANGGTIPHPELALKDLAELLRIYNADGPDASVRALRQMNEQLFADSAFRSELEDRWAHSRRGEILKQVLAAHDARLYGTAIPTALAQAEGLVVDAMGHTGRMGGAKLKEYLNALSADDRLYGPIVAHFITVYLLAEFQHGGSMSKLGRHSILHGGDLKYATKENSIALLVWLDYLILSAADLTGDLG